MGDLTPGICAPLHKWPMLCLYVNYHKKLYTPPLKVQFCIITLVLYIQLQTFSVVQVSALGHIVLVKLIVPLFIENLIMFIKDNKWVEALFYRQLTTYTIRPTFIMKCYTALKLHKRDIFVFPISYCHHNTQHPNRL